MEQDIFKPNLLCIHDLCRTGTTTLGPGVRYVIWTQGCPFHCDGCITPKSQPFSNEKTVLVSELAKDILSRPQIEGITISGGEPFLQATALSNLLDIILEGRPELTILSYTGYQIEQLSWPEAKRLLSKLDLLIDGAYNKRLNDNKGIRGSSNQRFYYLTSRLEPWKDEMEQGKRKVELHLGDGKITGIGVPSNDMNINH